jgi:hypothetical protein
MKFKQKCIKSIPFMIHKNSSTNDLTVNNSRNGGELLAGGALSCTTFSKETSIVAASVDGIVWFATRQLVGHVWVQPLWMHQMEKVVGVGGAYVHPYGWMRWKRWWGWVAYRCIHYGWM